MGTEIIGLLILSSLYVQQGVSPLPVAYAQEPVEPLVEIPQPVILDVPPKIPPILEKVALCESGGRQYTSTGKVIRGKVDPRDIGKWQINTYWNGAEAKRLGYDVFTLEGNTAMALHLYNTYGLKLWKASRHCWSA
jgi:hypothetical protein